jgi:hypothetical protein
LVFILSRDSVVGIATGYVRAGRPRGQSSSPVAARIFSSPCR